MTEIVRYNSEEIEVVLERMMELEDRVARASVLTNTIVSIETDIKFYFSDKQWEGVIIVSNAKDKE